MPMTGRARIRQRAVSSPGGACARPRPVLAQGADCGHDHLCYFWICWLPTHVRRMADAPDAWLAR
jgi:hypothetical protein